MQMSHVSMMGSRKSVERKSGRCFTPIACTHLLNSYLSSLQNRVQCLESFVREHGIDVDVGGGLLLDTMDVAKDEDHTITDEHAATSGDSQSVDAYARQAHEVELVSLLPGKQTISRLQTIILLLNPVFQMKAERHGFLPANTPTMSHFRYRKNF